MTAFADAFAHARRLTRKEKREKQNAKAKTPEPRSEQDFEAAKAALIEAGAALDEAKTLKRSLAQQDKEMALLPCIPRPGFKPRHILATSRLTLPAQGAQRKTTQAFAKSYSPKLVDIPALAELADPWQHNFMPEENERPRPTPQARQEAHDRLKAIDARIEAVMAQADAARALRGLYPGS